MPVLPQSDAHNARKALNGGAGKAFACPHCGLTLTIAPDKRGTRISFAVKEWQRLCKFPDLDSPVLCLAKRGSRRAT